MQDECRKWIGQRLENLRESKGISAREMSRRINKEETYFRKIETGKITPSIEMLSSICKYLGITLRDFFDSEVKNPESLNALIEVLKTLDKRELDSITSVVELLAEKKSK